MYIHIPFCRNKCPYCDFFSITDLSAAPRLVDALLAEMGQRRDDTVPLSFDTLYIGGGTPSVLDPIHIRRVIRAARSRFDLSVDAEVTMEVNPGTVSLAKLADYRAAGVNRLTIGIQSFQDRQLRFLGRIHTGREAFRTVAMARNAGFENVGLDLIYGLPGQTETAWRSDLETAVALAPPHLSCYMLTIEPGTPMAEDLGRGRFEAVGETAASDLFVLTQSVLGNAGYRQYEISNFARSASGRSKHNLKYWTFAPYLGLGPAAHSYRTSVRWWNHRSVERYLRDIGRGKPPVAEMEKLGRKQRMMEAIYLRLRTAEGIDVASFNRKFQADFNSRFAEPMATLEAEDMLSSSERDCRLTPKGMRFHEGVARMLIDFL